jgi:hypothetical protein
LFIRNYSASWEKRRVLVIFGVRSTPNITNTAPSYPQAEQLRLFFTTLARMPDLMKLVAKAAWLIGRDNQLPGQAAQLELEDMLLLIPWKYLAVFTIGAVSQMSVQVLVS